MTHGTIVTPRKTRTRKTAPKGLVFAESRNLTIRDASVSDFRDVVRDMETNYRTVPLSTLSINVHGRDERNGLSFTNHGFASLCSRTGMNRRMLDNMFEINPALAHQTVRDFIKYRGKENLLIVDGDRIEGVVTPRYQRISNLDVLNHILNVHGVEALTNASISGTRMRVNYTLPGLSTEPVAGDLVKGGIDILNSEDGRYAFWVNTFLYRLVCTNGMVAKTAGERNRMVHLGTKDVSRESHAMVSKATKKIDRIFPRLAAFSAIRPDEDNIDLLSRDVGNKLGRAIWGAVNKNAYEEAGKLYGGTEVRRPSYYDFWNGITAQGHAYRNTNMDKTFEIESAAFEIIDRHVRRHERAAA